MKTSNIKNQTSEKLQTPSSKNFLRRTLWPKRVLMFGAWCLSGVWCLVFGVFFTTCPLAQSAVTYPLRWRWSNPTPHGNNIINMAYLYAPPTQRAVQVTERGQIYTSDDLQLWTPRESGVTNALRSATFFRVGATNRLVEIGRAHV